jgi:hypothetical protein
MVLFARPSDTEIGASPLEGFLPALMDIQLGAKLMNFIKKYLQLSKDIKIIPKMVAFFFIMTVVIILLLDSLHISPIFKFLISVPFVLISAELISLNLK